MTTTHDTTFPALHGRPARGWLNDPNGLARVDGRYHVFFQHNPAAPVHDAIAWGHVSSDDLVTWQEEPLAIAPRPDGHDALGCWTGCAVDDDGVPTLVYSAVADRTGASHVVLARSDRTLRTWTRTDDTVVGMPDDVDVTDVRDPFLVEVEGRRYAVQGAGRPGGTPRLLVYAADDLARWVPLGTLLDGDDPVAARVAPADIWECPNLVRVGETWVLVLSLWKRGSGPDSFALTGVRYLVGDLAVTPDGPRFAPTDGGLLDAGPCFYAPQVLVDGDRVLLWAWSWELDRSPDEVAAAGWAGCLTFPRELSVVDGRVVSRPVPELEALRRTAFEVLPGARIDERAFEATVPAGVGRITLRLLHADGTAVTVAKIDADPAALQPVRVLVDGSMVEVFDGGPVPTTTRAYPEAGGGWVLDWAGDPGAGYRLGLPG